MVKNMQTENKNQIVFPKIDLEDLKASGIKAVLLDFDNTLYPYHPAHDYALSSCFKKFAAVNEISDIQISQEKFLEVYDDARAEIHKSLHGLAASHSRHLYFQRCFEKIFGRTCIELSLEFEELYWKSFLTEMHPLPEAIAFLGLCRKLQMPTCIVTDLTARVQAKKLVHCDLSQYIDFLVSSEEAGVEKPEAGIFDLALAKLGLGYEDVIMIGDNPARDIKGADALGIKSFLVETI